MRKSVRHFVALSVSSLVLMACQKETPSIQTSSTPPTTQLGFYNPSFTGKTIAAIYNGMDVQLLEIENGKYLYDGDVVLERKDFSLPGEPITNGAYRGKNWTNRIVYWKYAADVSILIKMRWEDAMEEFTAKAGFTFKPATATTPDYIEVQENDEDRGYSTSVGRAGGKQIISMDIVGFNTGSMIHELGHAIGLVHEHTRSDRDDYIIVKYSNIHSKWDYQFSICKTCKTNGKFDFESIMLYTPFATSAVAKDDKLPIMTKKDGSTWTPKLSALSAGDVAAINAKYK